MFSSITSHRLYDSQFCHILLSATITFTIENSSDGPIIHSVWSRDATLAEFISVRKVIESTIATCMVNMFLGIV